MSVVFACSVCAEMPLGKRLPAAAACSKCRLLDARYRLCEWCQRQPTLNHYCSLLCSGRATNADRRFLPDGHPNVTRQQRDNSAPGISARARRSLLAKWKRQSRRCAYCPAMADTIDHVVPLVRGGTSFEGNLVPACRRCNSGKSARLIVEWRTGLTCKRSLYAVNAVGVALPSARYVLPKRLRTRYCPACERRFTVGRRIYCSRECAEEWNARQQREAYRADVGLPATWDRPRKASKR